MIPVRDDVPARTYPVVTVALLVMNVAVYLFELSLGPGLDRFIIEHSLIPARFTGGGAGLIPLSLAAWASVLWSMFLHGGLGHLGGNMLYLWVFGDNVEDRLGHGRYLAFYLVCGALAALTHVWADPISPIPTVGASGAVAGVLGAYLMLYPKARVLTLIPIVIIPWFVRLPAVIFLGVWFVGQAISGGMYLNAPPEARGGVAVMAHVGGFIAGAVLCLLLKRPEAPPDRYRPRVYFLHE